jgi:ribosomal protein S12
MWIEHLFWQKFETFGLKIFVVKSIMLLFGQRYDIAITVRKLRCTKRPNWARRKCSVVRIWSCILWLGFLVGYNAKESFVGSTHHVTFAQSFSPRITQQNIVFSNTQLLGSFRARQIRHLACRGIIALAHVGLTSEKCIVSSVRMHDIEGVVWRVISSQLV